MRQRTCFQILKITNGQGDGYTTIFLLDYPYIKEHCKIICLFIYYLKVDKHKIHKIVYKIGMYKVKIYTC